MKICSPSRPTTHSTWSVEQLRNKRAYFFGMCTLSIKGQTRRGKIVSLTTPYQSGTKARLEPPYFCEATPGQSRVSWLRCPTIIVDNLSTCFAHFPWPPRMLYVTREPSEREQTNCLPSKCQLTEVSLPLGHL